MPEHRYFNVTRYVVKTQGNGVTLSINKEDTKGSFLELPKASLVEYDNNIIRVYLCGVRELNASERYIMAHEPKDEAQSKIDMMNDGSTMYYRRQSYYEGLKANYLRGHDTEKGLQYNINDKNVYDESIKGELSLEYKIN